MENLHEHDKVQQVTRDMETEDNEVTRSNQFHDAFVAAARVEAGNFIQENGLRMLQLTEHIWFGEIDLFG